MKIDIPELDFSDDTRGVSPVIGVILMVAITVILAAVIGAFVLDLGSQLGSTGPQTQLTVSDADASFNDGVNNSAAFTIEHKGGDDLTGSELKVTITNKSSDNTATWDAGTWSGTSSDLALASFTANDELTVGETVTVTSPSTIDAPLLTTGTEYTIKVIHKPSQSVVASSTVELS